MMKKIAIVAVSLLFTSLSMLAYAGESNASDQAAIRYAKAFTIKYEGNYKRIAVLDLKKKNEIAYQYLLVPRDSEMPTECEQIQCIKIPVRSVVTMSTTYLPYLVQLGVLDTLVGHDNFKHINSPAVLERIANDTLKEVGEGPKVNIELLMELEPELIMTHGNMDMYDMPPKFLEAGFAVVMNVSYTEPTPLGRAEWIKFVAAFFDRESEAEEIFQGIAETYETLAAQARETVTKPTVFVNAPYKGNWWMSGGQSYVATFLKDAGADYLWADDSSTTSRVIDFEVVYERAVNADFWVNTRSWKGLKDALATDERFAEFKAFQEGRVYNNNARINEHGGNDYWESGLSRPDIVLADLIKIFHPELVPDHQLIFYHNLK